MSAGLNACGADVSFRDVTIKIPYRNGDRDVSDVTHRKRGLIVEQSQLVEIETWARPDEFVSGAHVVWSRWKSQVYLSPYVEKPLNSKVIKGFVPEQSRKCFCVSGFLCSMYICNEHSMYISHIRVWLCYMR